MNHMTLIAHFAARLCARFTVLFPFTLPAQDSIQQTSSYAQPVDKSDQNILIRSRHAQVIHMLDTPGTLQARAHKGLTPGRRSVSRGVAIVIGISLSIPMSVADSGSIDAIDPKTYVRSTMVKKEAVCLAKLIGKESAWNSKAIGNLSSPSKSYTYGLLQLKNPLVKDKSPIEQIHYGLRYIDHRYDGDTCKAWAHWMKRGWH